MSKKTETLQEIVKINLDRKNAKKWRFISILLLISLVFVVFFQVEMINKANKDIRIHKVNHIAHVKIQGVVYQNKALLKVLKAIEKENSVKGLILEINTPGGGVVAAEIIYNHIKRIKKKKPIIASVSTLATSAGYLIASATDRIYAHKTSIIGSIGVLMQWPDFKDLLDNVGIKSKTLRSGKFKALPNPAEDTPAYVIEDLQNKIDEMHTWFVDIVTKERSIPLSKIPAMTDGRVFTGMTSIKMGLIDAIGNMDDGVEWLKEQKQLEEDMEVITYETDEDALRNDFSFKNFLISFITKKILPDWFGYNSSSPFRL